MENYREASSRRRFTHNRIFALCSLEDGASMAFTPFLCLELLESPLAPTEARNMFFGETSQVLLRRVEKRDSGRFVPVQHRAEQRALGQPCAALPAPFHVPVLVSAAEQTPSLTRAASFPHQSLLEQPQSSGTLTQSLLPALE